jgi:hypothetical protein
LQGNAKAERKVRKSFSITGKEKRFEGRNPRALEVEKDLLGL